MIRAFVGDIAYWDGRIRKFSEALREDLESLASTAENPNFGPQFWFDHSRYTLRVILLRYSRGDPIRELDQHFAGLLDAWELSNKLAEELNEQLQPNQGWDHRHLLTAPIVTEDPRGHNDPRAWIFKLTSLNHYNLCFWLVALALLLDIPEAQWRRLLALIDAEGEDVLLDRIIATRAPERKIGTRLLHKKPYARLLAAINAPKSQQGPLLKDFVDHWYAELARKGDEELWWYIYGDPVKHPLELGSYFGRWCLEAAVAAKVFGLDDSLCLGHEHYPGDFLRPDGPTTHPARPAPKAGLLRRLFGNR